MVVLTRNLSGALPSAMAARLRGRGTFQSHMIEVLHEALDPVVVDLKSKAQPASIGDKYRTRHILSGNQAGMDIINLSPNWVWKEYDTKGMPRKFPPYRQGTSLALWSRRHGKNPLTVARNIFIRGTTGNYIFTTVWQRSHRKVEQQVKLGYVRYIKLIMTGVG